MHRLLRASLTHPWPQGIVSPGTAARRSSAAQDPPAPFPTPHHARFCVHLPLPPRTRPARSLTYSGTCFHLLLLECWSRRWCRPVASTNVCKHRRLLLPTSSRTAKIPQEEFMMVYEGRDILHHPNNKIPSSRRKSIACSCNFWV